MELTKAFIDDNLNPKWRLLITELKSTVQEASAARNPIEEKYFVLERIDIENVRKCLDALHKRGEFPKTTDAFYIEYLQRPDKSGFNALPLGLTPDPLERPYPINLNVSPECIKRCEESSILNRRRARALGRLDISVGLGPAPFNPAVQKSSLSNPQLDPRVRELMVDYGDQFGIEGHLPPMLSAEDIKRDPDED